MVSKNFLFIKNLTQCVVVVVEQKCYIREEEVEFFPTVTKFSYDEKSF